MKKVILITGLIFLLLAPPALADEKIFYKEKTDDGMIMFKYFFKDHGEDEDDEHEEDHDEDDDHEDEDDATPTPYPTISPVPTLHRQLAQSQQQNLQFHQQQLPHQNLCSEMTLKEYIAL